MTDSLNTEGLVHVGEVESRAMRETRVAEDYHNAYVAGEVTTLKAVGVFVQSLYEAAGPYDDTRTLATLRTWIGDRIREVQ